MLGVWRNGSMSGVDWGTVIAAGITGLVGVVGIGGTLLSARMTSKSDAENLRTSISAEDARAKVAEKRRIYANCLAALVAASMASGAARAANDNPAVEFRMETLQRAMAAQQAAMNAVSEVQLIGSPEVSVLAMHCSMAATDTSSDWGSTYSRLLTTMRTDLGEPLDPEPIAAAPVIPTTGT